jgi:two-component system, NarL family, sensor histidine kinase UhpB
MLDWRPWDIERAPILFRALSTMDTHLPLLPASDVPPHRRQVSRDLLVVAAVTVGMFLFSVVFQLREWLTEVTHPLEPYQIDELPLTFAALALSLAWFAWRRWHQSEQELLLRVAAQRTLVEREAQLADTLAENRRLSQKYLVVQEEERRNLAREMHDELGQCLNAIKLDAVSICEASKAGLPQIESSARSIVELSNHVYEVVRSMMQRLRPAALDVLGLRDAVGELVNQWRRRNSGVTCGFESEGDLSGLGELINITVYRLVQECLTNVAKHSAASHVDVGLARTDALEVRVTVHDNGRGMRLQAKRSGLGLVGLRERVEALHGRLELTAAPCAGMHVTATLPLPGNG